MDDLWIQLKSWPKIDLHRHLEGSLRLETLSEIARQYGTELPGYDVESIRPFVQITEKPHTYQRFLEKFGALRLFYKTREIVERIAYEAIADAAADNVRYLELRFTPSALCQTGGFELEEVTQWVIGASRRAETDHGVQVGLLLSMNRHEPLASGELVCDLAIKYRGDIVGLDLAGDEVAYPAPPFAPLFQRAKQSGLGITVHAGEWEGCDSIVESVEFLGADRIGHGIRAIEDVEVVDYLRQHRVGLEICPTSNVQSGAVRNLQVHPLTDLIDQGLLISINTDDPSISNITLTDEYYLAATELGLSLDKLRQAILNAATVAFLPGDRKRELTVWFEEALRE